MTKAQTHMKGGEEWKEIISVVLNFTAVKHNMRMGVKSAYACTEPKLCEKMMQTVCIMRQCIHF